MTTRYQNLVFEGGGVKGVAYAGALKELEHWAIDGERMLLKDIRRVGGTSVGAIAAFLVATNHTVEEIKDILEKLDFSQFKDHSWLNLTFLKSLMSGMVAPFEGSKFLMWLGEVLAMKGLSKDITFLQMHQRKMKDLYVVATNLTNKSQQIFSFEHTPDVKIVDAVRASMSLPFFFKPHEISIGGRKCHYVDGGLLNNYPITIFDDRRYIVNENYRKEIKAQDDEVVAKIASMKNNPNMMMFQQAIPTMPVFVNAETLGFKVDSTDEISRYYYGVSDSSKGDPNSVTEYAMACFLLAMSSQDELRKGDKFVNFRTVFIDSLNVKMDDFNITFESKGNLVQSGQKAVYDRFGPDGKGQYANGKITRCDTSI